MSGYRGKSFEERARSLNVDDWSTIKDFIVVLSSAVDQLEENPASSPPIKSNSDSSTTDKSSDNHNDKA